MLKKFFELALATIGVRSGMAQGTRKQREDQLTVLIEMVEQHRRSWPMT